jgi:hypothetical protein
MNCGEATRLPLVMPQLLAADSVEFTSMPTPIAESGV